MRQSKLESILEQTCNMGSGFITAALAWAYIVAPMIHSEIITVDSPIIITIIFTVISFLRGYFWRRFFNASVHKAIHNFVRRQEIES